MSTLRKRFWSELFEIERFWSMSTLKEHFWSELFEIEHFWSMSTLKERFGSEVYLIEHFWSMSTLSMFTTMISNMDSLPEPLKRTLYLFKSAQDLARCARVAQCVAVSIEG